MLTLSVEMLVSVTGGTLLQGSADTMVNGVFTDSRSIEPGGLFVAFEGEKVDGHDYLGPAIGSGARALLVTRSADEMGDVVESATRRNVAIVRVSDVLAAVQALARHHRERLFCPVIGVTGSTGKTTTKEFLAAVLGTRMKVVSTQGNRNNELGVPLTVMDAGADTDVLIVEMAMRGRGQIAELCRIARPTMGLVTNVGMSHLELLGTQESIAAAKAELVEAIQEEGVVFLNGDDAFSATLALSSRAPIVTYGLGDSCDVRAVDITVDDHSLASFDIIAGEVTTPVSLAIPGRHNVYNALAAAAVAMRLGLEPDQISEGLAGASAGEMRMQRFTSAGGVHVINDAYNANPTSMRAAIDTLAGMTSAQRRIAVLGDMAELGSLAELAHFRIGEELADKPVDVLVTVGERAARIADGARAEGMEPDRVRPCATPEEASEVLDDLLEPGDMVLVKASRVMGLERVVEGIVEPRV
ncbi:MAG: UDP-N-acetylmuramoyl-tripeptide--D-alanyl-D-alanine ligase [Anaerosomatales bacterium]|nr:UDP-N-acetylmuramoyl-tripeptide--D-alanyl-D-alanine ligase [Anaerosomatales bacterium]MDT8433245.1 UDP-N-acetylmuramoyl-tripeptide--D-alanyl-D-alanine ligase [Anaerosomatales bacterium]